MLEELLIDQRLNAGARGLLLTGMGEQPTSLPAEKLVARRLNRLLTFDSRLPEDGRPVAFIGPRRAGKTTMIAKLAMRIRETFAINVGLVSADAARGGEGFHLGTFASLAGMPCIPLSRGAHAGAVDDAVLRLRDCDLVLIDTVSGEEEKMLAEIDCERLLVVSAQSDADCFVETALRYPGSASARLVVTHLDRCGYSGPLVQGLLEAAKPLSFFGIGQRVPDHIEPAAARRLARMLTRTLQ